ncbi:MAG: polysaccharide pyruvyl transferase family protein [Ruminococcus sp.]|uniref:polysaccharide pyruvyl transferase family protein n=1 Tax=Ruminococcus sp. TaxID=41978 RepID=UPI0025E33989|nr:polysaccharide pyruvyl transferase family protein [Ruminococcus sp.]MBO4866128.1 polysaccharide pyruvyl transferase family protein [Ruminococcus sp.]
MERGLKILLVCITNKNYGDTIIADCTEYLLHKALGRADKTTKVLRYSIMSCDLHQIRYVDAVIFAGGGLIKYEHEDFCERISEIVDEAEKCDVPVFLNAMGVEGYDEKDDRCQRLKKALNSEAVKAVTIRDDFELFRKKYAYRKGLRVKPVFDTAVWADKVYREVPADSDVIGLNVARGDIFADYGAEGIDEEYMLAFWKDLTEKLTKRGVKWKIFTNGFDSDEKFAVKLCKMLGCEKMPQVGSARQLVRYLCGFKAVVAVRMHACITSCALGLPCVGLVWNDKLRMWGEKIGTPDRYIEPDELNADKVLLMLDRAMFEGGKSAGAVSKMLAPLELKKFLWKECKPRGQKYDGQLADKIMEVGLGGIQHKYKAINNLNEMKRRMENGCTVFEADVRLTSDLKAVCVNSWSEKNLKMLGFEMNDQSRLGIPEKDFLSARYDGKYKTCSFEDVAKEFAVRGNVRLMIDIGIPPKEQHEALLKETAKILKATGLGKKRTMIRFQREKDIKLWNTLECDCTIVYFLKDSTDPAEREEYRNKAFSVCKKYGLDTISMVAQTYTVDTAELLKDKNLKPVIFSCDKVGDAVEMIERGAYLVGSNFYSARYIKDLTT